MDFSTVRTLHLFGIAFWLGVVSVEFILERSRTGSRLHGYAVARNHYWIDLALEIPAFVLVLVTGFAMMTSVPLTTLHVVKVSAGLLAIGSNVACVVPVVLRKRAADNEQLSDVVRYSRIIDLTAIVGVPAAVVAISLGFFLANG